MVEEFIGRAAYRVLKTKKPVAKPKLNHRSGIFKRLNFQLHFSYSFAAAFACTIFFSSAA